MTQVSSSADPKVGQPRWEWGTTPVCKAPEAGCTRWELASPPGHRGKVALRGLRCHAMSQEWGSLKAWRPGAQYWSKALHQPARLKRWDGLERSRLPPSPWRWEALREPGLLARSQNEDSLEGRRAPCWLTVPRRYSDLNGRGATCWSTWLQRQRSLEGSRVQP